MPINLSTSKLKRIKLPPQTRRISEPATSSDISEQLNNPALSKHASKPLPNKPLPEAKLVTPPEKRSQPERRQQQVPVCFDSRYQQRRQRRLTKAEKILKQNLQYPEQPPTGRWINEIV